MDFTIKRLWFDRHRDLGGPQHAVSDLVAFTELGDDGSLGIIEGGLL